MERKFSSFDKMIIKGFSADPRQDDFREDVGRNGMAEGSKRMPYEKEKTSSQIEICRLMNQMTNDMRVKYGLQPFDISVSNIHITGNNLQLANGTEIGGFFDTPRQRAIVREARSNTEFADFVGHELTHFKSFGAIQLPLGEETQLDYEYRVGFAAKSRDGKQEFFHMIDEALTEELTIEMIESLKESNHPLFANDAKETSQVLAEYGDKLGFSDNLMQAYYLPDDHPQRDRFRVSGIPYAYPEERQVLNVLIDKIYDGNTQDFAERDEVFDLFIQGKMQGNLLGIGRVIERTFGKGTFRKLGKVSSSQDIADYRDFVERLDAETSSA
jgi:hypothetical protein